MTLTLTAPGAHRATEATARPPCGAGRVLVLGAAVEGVLLAGLVRPLWLFGPREAITTPEPLATLLGMSTGGALRFAATLALWLGGYAAALALCRGPLTAGARRLLVLFPALFALTLLFVLPVSSKDVYHYVMEGRALAVYGDNPMSVPPAAYPDDPLAWTVSSWQDTPSRYGPAFNLPAAGIALIAGEHLTAAVLGFKLLALGALAGAAVLVWRTAGRMRPDLALPAFVLMAWNPLALYEAGANAHNDLLMVCFAALALDLAQRRRWQLALPALALGVLTKYVVVLLGPLLLIEAWRSGGAPQPPAPAPVRRARGSDGERSHSPRPRAGAGLGVGVGAGIAAALALTILLYVPFWDGAHTFDALRSASGDMTSSPGWLLRQALKHRFGWEGARPVVTGILTLAFVAGYALIVTRFARRTTAAVTHERRSARLLEGGAAPVCACPRPVAAELPRAAFAALLLYLCTMSWWLWPWYALWLLPPAALLAGRRAGLLAAVITGAALAAYVPLNFRELFWGPVPTDAMPFAAALTMFLPPLVVAAVLRVRVRWNRGEGREHG